jgi:hypothetical protein
MNIGATIISAVFGTMIGFIFLVAVYPDAANDISGVTLDDAKADRLWKLLPFLGIAIVFGIMVAAVTSQVTQ